MSIITKNISRLLVIILILQPCIAQKINNETKLKMIDAEIEVAKKQKKRGLLLMGLGLGIIGVGSLIYSPTFDLDEEPDKSEIKNNLNILLLSNIFGAGVSTYGQFQFRAASNTEATLKAKRYDFIDTTPNKE